MYEITNHSKIQAKKLGVEIKPSTNKNKKIDVFKDDKKVASIGAIGYKDYGIYLKEDGLAKANERRINYKSRHNKDRKVKGSPGFYADRLLW
jgi:hypothetical protein